MHSLAPVRGRWGTPREDTSPPPSAPCSDARALAALGTHPHFVPPLPCSKVQEMVHVDKAAWRGVQVVKRFTGGGTVVVDGSTVFSTLIMRVSVAVRGGV